MENKQLCKVFVLNIFVQKKYIMRKKNQHTVDDAVRVISNKNNDKQK